MDSARNFKPTLLNSAFTLVELLVAVGLILIITVATIPVFTSYLNEQTRKQAQELLKSELITARTNALTGSNPYNTQPITHWGVKVDNQASTYKFITVNVATGTPYCVTTTEVGSSNLLYLPENSIFTSGAANTKTCIFFSVSNGDVPGNSSISVNKMGSTTSTNKFVCVKTTGLVFLSDSSLCTPN